MLLVAVMMVVLVGHLLWGKGSQLLRESRQHYDNLFGRCRVQNEFSERMRRRDRELQEGKASILFSAKIIYLFCNLSVGHCARGAKEKVTLCTFPYSGPLLTATAYNRQILFLPEYLDDGRECEV